MITPNTLPRTIKRGKKRVGRGIGSGKGGHTVGRGQKGQKSRGKISVSFFGTKMKKSLLKRLPMQRGKGKFKSRKKTVVIQLGKLEVFDNKSIVDKDALVKAKLLKAPDQNVKVVLGGKLTKPLTIALPVSSAAVKLISKVGGSISS